MDGSAADRLTEVTQGLKTTSAKIRALASEGLPRADIARFLGVRYQHVRNVLVAEQQKTQSGAAARPAQREGVVQMDSAGRVLIPAPVREALGMKPGEEMLMRVSDGELRLFTREAGLRRAQRLLKDMIPPNVSLSEELIAERRAEAAREG
ncbi:MAG: AbrB/MazE/SpoVT family DNA-binding domain-containing protein [Maricaulaceae bacterium]|nr:AbrB/MazE/SpoVT family DNA-binding domain-containing protein [Maricaulaceae bacterium]